MRASLTPSLWWPSTGPSSPSTPPHKRGPLAAGATPPAAPSPEVVAAPTQTQGRPRAGGGRGAPPPHPRRGGPGAGAGGYKQNRAPQAGGQRGQAPEVDCGARLEENKHQTEAPEHR